MQRDAGVVRRDWQGFAQQNRTRVQAFVHLHDAHTRLCVPGFDGALDRRSPAPARQQRRMDVQAAQGQALQSPGRQQQTIGHHHHQLSLCSSDGLLRLQSFVGVFAVQTQAGWLAHRHAVRQSVLLHGRGLQFHAATGGAIGLGQHQGDVMASLVQCGQRRLGKRRGTGEHDAHLRALGFALGFEQLAFDAHAFERRQVLDKHLAHQVVHFVL